MSKKPKRPVLFAPCSTELLDATRDEAQKRDIHVSALVRRLVREGLNLPANFAVQPPERPVALRKVKKKLDRAGGRA
jgi:hypothetical protein